MYKELYEKNCLLYKNLDLLGKKWMIFLLLEMSKDVNNSYRYRDFEKILPGVTSRAISMRLDELVSNGLISKTRYEIKNVIISYNLTKSGLELIPIISQLQQWSQKFETCEPKSGGCSRCDKLESCGTNK
jgi:DNA-binding HxlR family transcriptional regulator